MTVWVNAEGGMCIGRFGRRIVDVHRTTKEQVEGGKQCAACRPRSHDVAADWRFFQEMMRQYHGVIVGDAWRPDQSASEGSDATGLAPGGPQPPSQSSTPKRPTREDGEP